MRSLEAFDKIVKLLTNDRDLYDNPVQLYNLVKQYVGIAIAREAQLAEAKRLLKEVLGQFDAVRGEVAGIPIDTFGMMVLNSKFEWEATTVSNDLRNTLRQARAFLEGE